MSNIHRGNNFKLCRSEHTAAPPPTEIPVLVAAEVSQFKRIPETEMSTDAALFDEVAALLGPNSASLGWSKEGMMNNQCYLPPRPLLVTDSRAFSCITPQRQALKRKVREEKEAIRKRQYHQRVKIERDALRQKAEALALELRGLQQSKCCQSGEAGADGFPQMSSSWKGLAKYQRDQRKKAEMEQTRLFAAAKMQAVYIGQLCEKLPGSSKSSKSGTFTSQGDGSSASKMSVVES
ncbi:hypothetical protein ON010_g6699 [Phytophthora cinnamomi]|nr:hypothetical protein ON010_g6699 [Phytophthora cinnamomi]